MKYLFDTNICIRILKGNDQKILDRISATGDDEICISSIVKFELLYGALKSQRKEENLKKLQNFFNCFEILPFDAKIAVKAAEIRVLLENSGTPIGPMDLLIAATAIHNNLILVTHNTREFSRINDLHFEDWEK
jgi:tRNA(fMet)-specific endonuclease VapC